jgi:menaquinone-9 beta-reductase
MADQTHSSNILSETADYDVAVVGASLAGCSAAIMLARAGARVALVEKSPNALAFKRVCSHYIQASAIPTFERLGLLEPVVAAGGLRSRGRIWAPWGWIEPAAKSKIPAGVNMRRERLDPMIRQLAGDTHGVDLILGHTAQELLRDGQTVTGVTVRNPRGETLRLRSKLVVGADGRDSRIAKLAKVATKTAPHRRCAYGGYFEGPAPEGAPDARLWLLDPHMAAAFPTDNGLTFYAAMPTIDHLPEFRADPEVALRRIVSSVPDAPPIVTSRLVGELTGKVDMTNVMHTPTAPGLALVGDAAAAVDPLWGVGCGFALQSSEWLADSVAPALLGSESLSQGLKRYRRLHGRKLGGHIMMINNYANGRPFNSPERLLFSAATYDERVARVFEAFGSRTIGPARMLAKGIPLALAANARHSLFKGGSDARPRPLHVPIYTGSGTPEGLR